MPITKGFRALVDEAMTQVKTYSVAEAKAKMSKPAVQIADIRDVRELTAAPSLAPSTRRAACSSSGSIRLLRITSRCLAIRPKNSSCFAALAAKTLQDMGMTNVAHIDGGFAGWVKQGAPTEALEERKLQKAHKT